MFFYSRSAFSSERGQGLIEYSLVLALVAIVIIAILTLFGETASDAYCSITYQIASDTDLSEACSRPIIVPSVATNGSSSIVVEAIVHDPDGDPDHPYATINKVEFYLDSSDNLVRTESSYRYCLGGGDGSCNSYNISHLSPGKHTIYIWAYDSDGNIGKKNVHFTR